MVSYHFVDEVSDHPSTAGVILFTVTTLLRAADDQSTTKPTAQSIRVMSFNIRNSGEDDHGQRLPNRRDLYFQKRSRIFRPISSAFRKSLPISTIKFSIDSKITHSPAWQKRWQAEG